MEYYVHLGMSMKKKHAARIGLIITHDIKGKDRSKEVASFVKEVPNCTQQYELLLELLRYALSKVQDAGLQDDSNVVLMTNSSILVTWLLKGTSNPTYRDRIRTIKDTILEESSLSFNVALCDTEIVKKLCDSPNVKLDKAFKDAGESTSVPLMEFYKLN